MLTNNIIGFSIVWNIRARTHTALLSFVIHITQYRFVWHIGPAMTYISEKILIKFAKWIAIYSSIIASKEKFKLIFFLCCIPTDKRQSPWTSFIQIIKRFSISCRFQINDLNEHFLGMEKIHLIHSAQLTH